MFRRGPRFSAHITQYSTFICTSISLLFFFSLVSKCNGSKEEFIMALQLSCYFDVSLKSFLGEELETVTCSFKSNIWVFNFKHFLWLQDPTRTNLSAYTKQSTRELSNPLEESLANIWWIYPLFVINLRR